MQDLENHLPIEPQYRRSKLGGYSPIRVVNVVFAAGDANHGVQTAAFNLPNDERVVTEKGSKRVLLKNFQQAKFEQVLVPISKQALAASDQSAVVFDAFFTHILMHELMHGLGPQTIRVAAARHSAAGAEGAERSWGSEGRIFPALGAAVPDGHGRLDKAGTHMSRLPRLAVRTLRFAPDAAHAKGRACK